jgi:hypothetical protein
MKREFLDDIRSSKDLKKHKNITLMNEIKNLEL